MSTDATSEPPVARKPRPWQFSLGRLMVIILVIAVLLALVRWWGMAGWIALVTFVVFAVPIWLRRRGTPADLVLLKSLIVYGIVSALTLPFLNALWLGEIPLLALIQIPKVEFVHWLRRNLVMVAIHRLGLSRGSFSPDYNLARPYALAITYLIPLSILLTTLWVRKRMVPPYRRWTTVLILVAILDFCFTLFFAGGPGLSIY